MSKCHRLYESFQPTHYDVFWDINRQTKQIQGTSTITGQAQQVRIGIHEKNLTITAVTVNRQPVSFIIDQSAECLEVLLTHSGEATIKIDFTAPLTDTMSGIYPSYYMLDGQQQQIVSTQFEPVSAREAFPCIDEPEAKATFDLAIKFDERPGETVISNMPERSCLGGVHRFDTSKKMSTYLLAFALGTFQTQMTKTKSGVKVGVFASPVHDASELMFALDIARRTIEFYEDYFQVPYPLPHCWQVALPDFSMGAMENWGMVTYRESCLLMDPQNTPFEEIMIIATSITHELAHQWFGDLVTMKWWDDLWLNESFADMMQYLAFDELEPEWGVWDMFQYYEVPQALHRDAVDGIQAVHQTVDNPAEIKTIFDSGIVYAKGARLLAMVRKLVGEAVFRKGLQLYFTAHQYGNATGTDLWDALRQASGVDVGTLMDTWLNQPGYPVIDIRLIDDEIHLHQQQFFIGEGTEVQRQWQIPLTSNYSEIPTLMTSTELRVSNYSALRSSHQQPLIFNTGNQVHVIIQYDTSLLIDILAHLDELDRFTQLQILQNRFLLASGNRLSFATLVSLLPYFSKSHDAVVMMTFFAIADELKKFVARDSPEENKLKQYFNRLTESQLERVGVLPNDTDDLDTQLIRPLVLKAAWYGENQNVKIQLHQLFQSYQENRRGLAADLRRLVLQNELTYFGSPELFNALWHDYLQTTDASYRADLRGALGRTKDKQSLRELISKLKDPDAIKPQDLLNWYAILLTNPQGQAMVWEWLKQTWPLLKVTFTGDSSLSNFVSVTADWFHTLEELQSYMAFFGPQLSNESLAREIRIGEKQIKTRIDLISREREKVVDALIKILGHMS